MAETIFSLLLRELREEAEELREFIARGSPADVAAYHRLTGKYQALREVEARVKELESHYIDD
jgi:hypothetical protein